MGIPSYFYSIIRKYGDRFFGAKRPCKRLFLDLNCCIHGCKNRILESYSGGNEHELEQRIIDEVIRTIIHFGNTVEPSDLLWIAVDGVVPVAKMIQQRERRFRATEERNTIQSIYESHGRDAPVHWDSNAITPGTPFMLRLCDTISCRMDYIQSSVGVKSIQLNGVRNPGEGEQKIFEYMRRYPGSHSEYDDVIYGLDADLIILSLLQTIQKDQLSSISLLREEQAFGKIVKDIDTGDDVLVRFRVSELATYIPLEWSGEPDPDKLNDYIFLMALMGNDFVPHTPSLTFRSEGMERIIEAYLAVGERLITASSSVRWDVLTRIISKLARDEVKILQTDADKTAKIRSRIRRGEVPFRHAIKEDPVEQEIAALDWQHLKCPDTIEAGSSGWQARYYESCAGCYGDTVNLKDVMIRVSDEYMNSLQWCWMYYNGLQVPTDKCYSFASGPLLEDLVKFIPTWKPAKYTKGLDIPVEAQLLVVLPPQSHCILPEWVRSIAEMCPDLYPSGVRLWTYGKRHIWECVAILPRIPIERVTALVRLYRPYNSNEPSSSRESVRVI